MASGKCMNKFNPKHLFAFEDSPSGLEVIPTKFIEQDKEPVIRVGLDA